MSSMSGSMGMGSKIPKGYEAGRMQQFTPQQMQLFQQMFGQVGPNSQTSRLAMGDEGMFNQLEAPAMRQFAGLQGNIASRFSGMGMGSRNSSGFQNTMNTASSNFAQDLQAQRMALQQQAVKDLMGMSGELLGQRPYENFMVKQPNRPNFMQSLIGGVAPIAGAAIGGMAGGPMGMAMGANIGSQFGSAFGGGQPQQSDWNGMSGLSNSWGNNNSGLRQMAQGIRG